MPVKKSPKAKKTPKAKKAPRAEKKPQAEKDHWGNLASYHSADVEALLQRHRQVEKLIGSQHHSPSEGYHCELLLTDYLRKVFPEHYSVDTGFIRGNPIKTADGNLIVASPQIDILIHNTHEFSPIYRMGNLVVVLPESVIGIIEVKKNFTSGQLEDALNNIAKTMLVLMPNIVSANSKIFTAAVSFGSNMTIHSKTYENRLKNVMKTYGHSECLPTQVTDLSKGVLDLIWNPGKSQTDVFCREACITQSVTSSGKADTKLNITLQCLLCGLMVTTNMQESLMRQVTRYSMPTQLRGKRQFSINGQLK